MDALTFIISVKSEGAISAVQQLKTSMAGLQSMAHQLKTISLVNMAQGLGEFSTGIKELVGPGADFQQSMADLSAITGIAGKDLETLGESARQLGEKSGVSATDAAESFKLLASNINIAKIGGVAGLTKLQEKVITLAHAAGTDLPTAANAMTFALNEFQMPVSDAARVMNVLGAGAKYGAAFIPDLSESLKNVGSVAHMSGLSIEETTGAIEILSQRGIKGAEAGVMLRNVLLMLQTRALPGVDMKTQGFVGALKAMQKYMGDTTLMTQTFRRESLNAAQILIGSADAVGEMGKRVTGTNVAVEQAEIRTKTYKHTVEEIRAKFDEFKISIFNSTQSFLPWVEVVGEGTASFAQLVPALWMFKEVVSGIVPVIGIMITNTRNMISCLEMATTAQEALNIAWITNPIGVIIAGVAVLGGAIYLLTRNTKELSVAQQISIDLQKETASKMVNERFEVDRLFTALKKTNPESKERKDIIDELNEKYKDYLPNMDLEKAKAEEIATAYSFASREIEKKAKAEAAADMMKALYKKKYELAPEAAAEKKRNELTKKQLSDQAEKVKSGKADSRSLIGYTNAIDETKEKAAIVNQSQIDTLDAIINSDRPIIGNAKNAKSSTPKKMINIPGASGEDAGKALSGISGDSKAIKNININIGSFIHENKNIIEKADMSLGDLEAKMRKVFFSIVNDANYAAQ